MEAFKTTMVRNKFLFINIGSIANVADWKINADLEYFRYMGIQPSQLFDSHPLWYLQNDKNQFIRISVLFNYMNI